ncbi:cysteine synthase A [Mesorhizobium sp.]|uniref:cysteine synthase A n=1 Tax=Mesorhizobium sp. TaxID=1871066 RepID=UPI000FE2F148|nr:cysteine synthase A [Mesorhizobium sp.]RWN53117.1 MAG: cysteine synthase A [Mesorhizobium sp.]RWN73738.1 MAG: cysteine synthase A [Mesorhizobium sp.]RWN76882.1 MAG: cysteine synthase A [Mesorhizobium sp.]RWN88057.1 MAG: cysteine synthase A [Mesorhizobium sp.]RWO12436.1 MAG: cysteine synthase A [Mesorhizobium sp.]
MSSIYDSILDTIGDTPVVRLSRINNGTASLFAKIEAFNPGGSIKDRFAAAVIEEAEGSGALRPGQTVIEATSGNTGVGLAMVCARKGYPLVIVMPENASVERRKLMRFFGAKVVLTPAVERGSGMLAKAIELAGMHGWLLCRQFETPVNAEIHARTTALEILAAFQDRPLDYWVTGTGTGGTLAGVARVLKRERPETRIIVCEPDNSALLSSGIPQSFDEQGLPTRAHTRFRPHPMQGWSPDFIPQIVGNAMADDLVDEILPVSGASALEAARRLATEEGILAGISGGATLSGALEIARRVGPDRNVLCMLPDTGERYLSTILFDNVSEEMSPAEEAISHSTPGYRFDRPPSFAFSSAPMNEIQIEPSAHALVDEAIHDPERPVVIFALTWCEFCWTVRKLFDRAGIAYRSIEIDTPEFQKDGLDGEIRKALRALIGSPTIPQVFVGGEHIGGCMDTLAAWRDGTLAARLEFVGANYTSGACANPESLLPRWVRAAA